MLSVAMLMEIASMQAILVFWVGSNLCHSPITDHIRKYGGSGSSKNNLGYSSLFYVFRIWIYILQWNVI